MPMKHSFETHYFDYLEKQGAQREFARNGFAAFVHSVLVVREK